MTTRKKIHSPLPEIPGRTKIQCLYQKGKVAACLHWISVLPGHLLAEIFIRLLDPEDLARASAACVTFRRVVTDGSFLRRFRRLHPPPVLGFLCLGGFHPAQPPHTSAPAARALALAADFSFSFLPSRRRWAVQDIRDGRVLLVGKQNMMAEGPSISMFPELVVCDPLHRRYILLPPLPDGLVASVERQDDEFLGWSCEPSLIPLSDEEAALVEETTFRVIWSASCKTNMAVFVFSSTTGQWRATASQTWSDLVIDRQPLYFIRRHLVGGCVYWVLPMNNTDLLVLDTRTMEFSIADLPPGQWNRQDIAIVDAGEGRLGMLSTGGTEKYLILLRIETPKYLSLSPPIMEFCKLDVRTMQVERMCAESSGFSGSKVCLYADFPPSLLSSPTV
ncbi:uncharacterized protein [Triticum aestivum]|nr:uncharacterized protein LOC123171218 [Triticum aestivum]